MNQWPLEQYQNDPEFFMYLSMGQFRAELARLMQEMPEINQKKLSELLGRSEARISNILHSSPNITMKTMCELAGAFGKMLEVKLVDRANLGQDKPACSEPAITFFEAEAMDQLVTPKSSWTYAMKGAKTQIPAAAFFSSDATPKEEATIPGVCRKRRAA